jgi:CheY-like chemotaxis protein
MNRILLVDDSPHAQRIGERILTEEGFEVVTVSNADTALVRIEDVDPDVVIADAVMPGRTGYEICQYLKMNPRYRHVRVVLTAGVLEPLDEAQSLRVQADASIKKPFEASVLLNTVRPLAEAAAKDRPQAAAGSEDAAGKAAPRAPATPFVAVVDEEQVRAAVTVALDGAMEAIVDQIARRVVAALQVRSPGAGKANDTAAAIGQPGPGRAAAAVARFAEPVRRINPLRSRTSILGLESEESQPENSPEA